MCEDGPSTVGEALASLRQALEFLHGADAAGLPSQVQAETLRALERAEAAHTAARARWLAAFLAQDGYEADGQGSGRTWLVWQTRVTAGAAAAAMGWARRLAAHPVIGQALAAGEVSASWARHLCAWSDRLPGHARGGADEILAAAAAGGAGLSDLAGLAEQMYQRACPASGDDGGDEGRYLRLGITLGGAGRLDGELTPGCSAALTAVLAALGGRAGPEDTRTMGQRRHDALAEACTRLIAAGGLPGGSGHPAQALVHLTLRELRDLPGASAAEAAWFAARGGQPGWLTGPETAAAACDASLAPVVTGHIDWAALDRLTGLVLAYRNRRAACTCGGCTCRNKRDAPDQDPAAGPSPPLAPPARREGRRLPPGKPSLPPGPPPASAPHGLLREERLREELLRAAADVLSGPGGLAAWLRTSQLSGPLAGPGLPLDVPLPLDAGQAQPTIPAHLRRAVVTRHRTCAFPGCGHPAARCHIHHLIPRARGGPTTLANLVPLCPFHHLTAIHRWGWTLTLHADGTTTAASPDRARLRRSHGPPGRAA